MRVFQSLHREKAFHSRYVFMMTGIIFLPVLFFFLALFPLGRLFANEDTLLQFYPYAAHLSRALKEGSSLLFTNTILGGFPLGATMQGGFFHPLHDAIFLLFGWVSGYHALVLLYYGGGVVMYALLRRLGTSAPAAAFGTMAYLVSQPVLSWVAVMPITHAIWLFPVLFFFVHRLSERITPVRDAIALALILAGSWFAAAPQIAVYAAVAGGCFAIFCDYRSNGSRGPLFFNPFAGSWRVFFTRYATTLQYGVAGVASALLASPYIFFAQIFNALSNRPALTFAEYHATALEPTVLLRYIIPSLHVPYVIPAGAIAVGFIPLLFSIIACAYARRDSIVKFFGAMVFMALLAALKYSPLMAALHYIPVFKYFRGPARFSFVAAFGLCVLAAKGFALLETGERVERVRVWVKGALYGWLCFAGLGVIVAVAAAFLRNIILARLTAYFDTHLYAKTSQLPPEHYHRVIARYFNEGAGAFSLASPEVLAVIIPTITALYVLHVMLRQSYKPIAGVLLTLLIFIEGIAGYIFLRPFIVRSALVKPKTLQALESLPRPQGPYRTFSFQPMAEYYQRAVVPFPDDRETQSTFLMEMLAPNAGMFWGIATIDGYENLMPRDIARVLAFSGSERSTAEGALVASGDSENEITQTFFNRLPLLGRLGVRYIISARPLEHFSLALMKQLEVTRHAIPVFIYEYAGAWPLVEFMQPNDNDQLNLVAFKDALVRFATVTQMPQRVIIRNVHLPGWHAFIDGNAAPIHETEDIFQLLEIPAGEHEVELIFSYRKAIGI